MTDFAARQCAQLAAGIINPDSLANVLGGSPWGEPLKPVPAELRALGGWPTPASHFAGIVCNIGEWFEYHAPDVAGAGLIALRRFARQLTVPEPDYRALADDLDTLGWLINQAYPVLEDEVDGLS
jgi:hypothetical protein